MWELDNKKGWALKNWCFWTVVLEKTLESPLDCKEIQPVHPKRDPSWAFIGSTDVEAETPVLCLPDTKNWLIGKDPDAGKDWRQEKGMREANIVGWHHRLDGHEFEQALRVGDGQGGLECCRTWGCKESDMTTWLNWTVLMSMFRHLLCCWKRAFAISSVLSCQKSVSLCPSLFCTPRPNLPVTPGISGLPTFAF